MSGLGSTVPPALSNGTTGAATAENCTYYRTLVNLNSSALDSVPIPCRWYSWIIAVVAILIASSVSNIGFNLQKLALKKNKDNAPPVVVKVMWVGGLVCIVLAALGDVVALTFGDVSLVTPLGVFTLVANIFFANFFHGEKLYLRDGIFTGVIMAGSVLTTVFAPHQGSAETDSQIFDVYKSEKFAWYATVIVVLVAGIFIFTHFAEKQLRRYGVDDHRYSAHFQRFHRVSYPLAAGVIGAQAVLIMKSLTQVVTAVGGVLFLTVWQFYVLLVVVGALEVGFLTAMNLGLDRWDAMLVVPVFQTFWTLTSVIGAIVLDDEFAGFADCTQAFCVNGFSMSYIFFPLGLLVAVLGVYFLSKRKSNQQFLADAKQKKEEEERRRGVANKLVPADSFSRSSKSRVVLGHTSIISEESENDEGDANEHSDQNAKEEEEEAAAEDEGDDDNKPYSSITSVHSVDGRILDEPHRPLSCSVDADEVHMKHRNRSRSAFQNRSRASSLVAVVSVTAGGGDELEDEPDPSPLILSSAASKPTASSPPTEGEQGANNEDKEENQKNNVWARFIDIEVRSSISDLEGLELEPFVVDVYCPDTQQEWPFTVLVVTKAPLSSRGAHAVETASKDTGSARDAAAAASESKSKDSKKPDKTLQLTPKILENDIILKANSDTQVRCGWLDSRGVRAALVRPPLGPHQPRGTLPAAHVVVRRVQGLDAACLAKARARYQAIRCLGLVQLAFARRRVAKIADCALIKEGLRSDPYHEHIIATGPGNERRRGGSRGAATTDGLLTGGNTEFEYGTNSGETDRGVHIVTLH